MIKFIMFLNKRIIGSKSKYWFIQLKITKLIWILRKIHHIIESTQQFFIIYTNHGVIVKISRQVFLFTSFINKFNLHLIKASEYIQKCNLIIKHKSDKKYVISNVLFKLISINLVLNIYSKEFKVLIAIEKSINFFFVVEIFKDIRDKIIAKYQNKSIWTKTLKTVTKAERDIIRISFQQKNDLFYFVNDYLINHNTQRQFCLFQNAFK